MRGFAWLIVGVVVGIPAAVTVVGVVASLAVVATSGGAAG